MSIDEMAGRCGVLPGRECRWEDELPLVELPEDPTWRENFCFDGYDRVRNIGFWIHCGRWSKDPSIWREQVLVYWPDGDYYLNRSWGARPSERGPSAALLDLVCEEPGKRWRLRYRGPTRRASQAEVLGDALPEGAKGLMDLDVVFTSDVQTWFMSGIEDAPWAKFHTEQTGRLEGSIAVDGEVERIDGLGWHDHSRGPRDIKDMGRHAWIHGNLSQGRSFALTVQDNFADGAYVNVMNKAVVWDGGVLYQAHCPDPPMLVSAGAPPERYRFRLEYDGGTIEVDAEPKRCLPHSTTRFQESFDGVCPGLAQIVTYEQGTVFHADGEAHDGHTERSFRLEKR